MRWAAAIVAFGLSLAACGHGDGHAKNADVLLAPLSPVTLGGSLAELRRARPGLEAIDATSWVDGASDDRLTVDADGDRIVGVRLELAGEVAERAERELRGHLGSGAECSPLPENVPGFRTTLWRLPDGSGVSVSRMGARLKLRFIRPIDAAFEAAISACTMR